MTEPTAEIEHRIPGRICLRVTEKRGDAGFFGRVVAGLTDAPGVRPVKPMPGPGPSWIRHAGDEPAVFATARERGAVQRPSRREAGPSFPLRPAGAVSALDLAAPGLAGAGVVQLARGQVVGSASGNCGTRSPLYRGPPSYAVRWTCSARCFSDCARPGAWVGGFVVLLRIQRRGAWRARTNGGDELGGARGIGPGRGRQPGRGLRLPLVFRGFGAAGARARCLGCPRSGLARYSPPCGPERGRGLTRYPSCRERRAEPAFGHEKFHRTPLTGRRRDQRSRPDSFPARPRVQRRGAGRARPGSLGGAAHAPRQMARRLLYSDGRRRLLLDCERAQAAMITQRLARFRLRSHVSVRDASGGIPHLCRLGRRAGRRWRGCPLSARSASRRGRVADHFPAAASGECEARGLGPAPVGALACPMGPATLNRRRPCFWRPVSTS